MQRFTAKHQAEFRESFGRVGDRIEGGGGVKGPTKYTNLGPWELRKTDPPTKVPEEATLSSYTFIAVV